jgi:hypothetical protein
MAEQMRDPRSRQVRAPEQRSGMTQSTQEQNKAPVLRASDLLFNQRDHAAAEKFWSPHYIQLAHIELGPECLFNLIRSLPAPCVTKRV